ncbi:secreted protein [Moniliophthora roreri MCA 2997]|uniref:Secreted protein n=1 Tax=Moniliophthora roreri (strain MCA 2997) TaxID=1381753 RepID=V2XGU6_MONRO|nr:secreted protein [Moniliophthora roreri MCA 2997]
MIDLTSGGARVTEHDAPNLLQVGYKFLQPPEVATGNRSNLPYRTANHVWVASNKVERVLDHREVCENASSTSGRIASTDVSHAPHFVLRSSIDGSIHMGGNLDLGEQMMLRVALFTFAVISTAWTSPLNKRAVDFFDPRGGGGSMLDNAGEGGGEPLNVIISGLSSPGVLTDDGIVNYARAIGFSTECFGIHLGDPQTANLGDGNGDVPQAIELREDYGDAEAGTCLESLIGGNHFRVWHQNGAQANSGALFLAVSHEEDVTKGHTISPDGYNQGRNQLVQNAVGRTDFNGVNYSTTARNITGLLPVGADGINHGIAIDGIVTLLTVTIV